MNTAAQASTLKPTLPRAATKSRMDLEKPLVALAYTRVSTVRQAVDGVSLDAQVNRTLEHAAYRGWPVVGAFREEGVSGKLDASKRPALREMLARARELQAEGKDVVIVVYSVSRLARSQRVLMNILEGEKLQISSVTEAFDTTTPAGKAMLGMLAVFAQLLADMGAETTRECLAEAKAQGMRLGQKTVKDLAPEIAQKVKDLKDAGASLQGVADQMNITGVPTPTRWLEDAKLRGVSTLSEWMARGCRPTEESKWVKDTVVRCIKSANALEEQAKNDATAQRTSRIHG